MKKQNFLKPLNLACLQEKGCRPIFNYIHIVDGYLLATDTHILIKQPLKYHTIINSEKLNGKSIHYAMFAQICKYQTAEATDDGILCIDKYRNQVLYKLPKTEDLGKVPDFERVINNATPTETGEIIINPHSLDTITRTMFFDTDKKVSIIPCKTFVNIIKPTSEEYADQSVLMMGYFHE